MSGNSGKSKDRKDRKKRVRRPSHSGGDITTPDQYFNALWPSEIMTYLPPNMIIDLSRRNLQLADNSSSNSSRFDIERLRGDLALKYKNMSSTDRSLIKDYVTSKIRSGSGYEFIDTTGPYYEARKNINSTPDVIAKLPEDVQSLITQYKTFVANNFRDGALETTWQNVRNNPNLLINDKNKILKSYLIRTSGLLNMYWRWAGRPGQYPTNQQIEDKLPDLELTVDLAKKDLEAARKTRVSDPSKSIGNAAQQEIDFLQNQLDNGSTLGYSYDTVQLLKKRIEALKAV